MWLSRIEEIRQRGFEGFIPIFALQRSLCCEVPDTHGVYLVLGLSRLAPRLCDESTGGYFMGKNPTVPIKRLEKKWVENALVLYIGKAGPSRNATLRIRLKTYMQFGQGQPVPHWGGRYIWQLRGSANLIVCWKTTHSSRPRDVEKEMILEFEKLYFNLPFANLCH
jgi:hypothetical protein